MSLATGFDIMNAAHRERLRKCAQCSCAAHRLHRVVFGLMMHKCCSTTEANCRHHTKVRKDGTCDKRFPREAGTPNTQLSFTDTNGFFHPRRPFPEDAYVVPYNRLVLEYGMTATFPSGFFFFHNNWDQCAGAHTLEYVFEYQHKGPDFTEVSVEEAMRDISLEFKEFQRLRHVGFVEAFMRFMNMELVRNEPAVTELSVHLENQQFVAVEENIDDVELQRMLADKETPLLRYFWRSQDLLHLRFHEYFALYTLKPSCPSGKVQVKDRPPATHKVKFAVRRTILHVCRLEYGSRQNVERYCLGLILRRFARGSYADCKQVDGVTYKTFAEAAYALGIFSDHDEYDMCLRELLNPNPDAWDEAAKEGRPVQICGQVWKARNTFLTMLMNGAASQKLFDDFAWYLTRDVITRGETTETQYEFWLLQWVKRELFKNQLTLEDVGLNDPSPEHVNEQFVREHEAARTHPQTIRIWIDRIPQLDEFQRPIFAAVVKSVLDPSCVERLFYVDARAGCGKTFLCQCISAFVKSQNRIVLTSAPSALAASLHMGGCTTHKCFGLPVTNDRVRRESSLTSRSYQGKALRLADLLIIDEISMMDALNFDCADRVTREISGKNVPFGGKVLLCCGEFAQLPPVIPNGRRPEILAASVITHTLWDQFTKASLHKRWRSVEDIPFQAFCDALTDPVHDGFFDSPKLPSAFRIYTTTSAAVEAFVGSFKGFPDTLTKDADFDLLARSPIYVSIAAAYHHLAAMDIDTEIAHRVRMRLHEPIQDCVAHDEPVKGPVMSPEFMDEVARRNHQVPVASLRLFRGCKVRLLRNFQPAKGLCNGTLLIIRKIGRHHLEAQILSEGEYYGNVEVLFRFKFDIEAKAISFSRMQFPIALAFGGTVHRFQGQSSHEDGLLLLDIRRHPFCHGQAYVAYSRARRASQVLLIAQPQTTTAKCLVYQELSSASLRPPQPNSTGRNPGTDEDAEVLDLSIPPYDPVVVSSEGWDGKLPRPRTDCTDDVDDDVDDIDF